MALHDDLLALAIRLVGPMSPIPSLVPPAAGSVAVSGIVPPTTFATPPEAELRRAISTAYYALFHLLIDASTARGVSVIDLRPYLARNFEHRQMLAVCKKYAAISVDMIGQPVCIELQRVANCFVQLQNARHKADYTIKDTVTLTEAQTLINLAKGAFADWAVVAATSAGDTYLTELLVGGIKDR